MPRLVARLAENPVDDRLLGPLGGRHAERVGADVVLPPDLAGSLGSVPLPLVTLVMGRRVGSAPLAAVSGGVGERGPTGAVAISGTPGGATGTVAEAGWTAPPGRATAAVASPTSPAGRQPSAAGVLRLGGMVVRAQCQRTAR